MMKEKQRPVNFLSIIMAKYDFSEFDRMVDKSKSYLLKMDSEKKMEIVHCMIKIPLTKKAPDHKDKAEKSLKKQKRLALLLATSMYERSEGEIINPSKSKKTSVTSPEDQMLKAEEAVAVKKLVPVIKPGAKRLHGETEYGEEEENADRAKKRENKTMIIALPLPLPKQRPELPARFKGYIQNLNGNTVVLVIQKPFQHTDLDERQGRLSLPLSQIRNEFLSCEENEFLDARTGQKGVPKIKAQIIEPWDNKYSKQTVYLRKWDMVKKSGSVSTMYNLGAGWNVVAKNKNNGLSESMIVQLWSFRVGPDLWFALVKVGSE